MKIKRVIDGDTVEVKWKGYLWTVRIYGLDADELKDNSSRKRKRAEEQKEILKKLSRWARVVPQITKGKRGKKIKQDAYGRFLCRVKVWRWWRYVDYSEYMIKKGKVKKGSKWNGK